MSADGAEKLDFKLKRIALFGEESGSIVAGLRAPSFTRTSPSSSPASGPPYAAVNEAIQTAIQARMAQYAGEFAATAAELGLDEPG